MGVLQNRFSETGVGRERESTSRTGFSIACFTVSGASSAAAFAAFFESLENGVLELTCERLMRRLNSGLKSHGKIAHCRIERASLRWQLL